MVCNRIYYNIYCIVKKLAKDIVKKFCSISFVRFNI